MWLPRGSKCRVIFDNSVVIRVASKTLFGADGGIEAVFANSTRALEENWIFTHPAIIFRLRGWFGDDLVFRCQGMRASQGVAVQG